MAPANETSMAWVSPQRLTSRWTPEMFRAEYLELDRTLSEADDYIRIGDIVDVVIDSEQTMDGKWYIDRGGIRRRVELAESPEATRSLTRVPPEAILVTKSWIDCPDVRYWNSGVFRGDAAAHWNFWVLRTRTGDRLGWLYRELQGTRSKLQLQRAATVGLTTGLQITDLLDIRVKSLGEPERQAINDSVETQSKLEATSLLSRKLSKPFFLTGRTFEERMRQFESFLETEALFSSRDAFFVEPATRNSNSNFFRVRPVRSHDRRAAQLIPQEIPSASDGWRNWFWDRPTSTRYKLFNSLLTKDELPTELLACIVPSPPELAHVTLSVLLPAFSTFRDTVVPVLEADVGVEDQVWFDVWTELQSHLPVSDTIAKRISGDPLEQSANLFRWSRLAYRPLLALKVMRDESPVGAYLLIGADQLPEPLVTFSELDDLGVILSDVLYPPSNLVSEAANRESLRRLSVIMHQVKGPIGRILTALGEVREFLADHPEVGGLSLLSETDANRFARMPGARPSGVTVSGRLEIAEKAAEEVKRVSEQLIQLRLVQSRSDNRERFSLSEMLRELGKSCSDAHSGIAVRFSELGDWYVCCDKSQIKYAVDEVLNNAVRELRFRNVAVPCIDIRCGRSRDDVWIAISDNGLPVETQLIERPFQECESTYDSLDLGTGLGLTIVRETFLAHGGDCSLHSNADDEERLPGVTFYAHLKALDPLGET